MSAEEKLRKLRRKRTLEILVNSRRGKLSSEFAESGEFAWSVLFMLFHTKKASTTKQKNNTTRHIFLKEKAIWKLKTFLG